MTTYNRPLVVELRDWLTCLVLLLASAILLSVMVLGYGVADAVSTTPTSPQQLVPDPGIRPSPMPGPPVQLPR